MSRTDWADMAAELAAEVERLRAVLAEIAKHECWLRRMKWKTDCRQADAVGPCAPCRARAALEEGP